MNGFIQRATVVASLFLVLSYPVFSSNNPSLPDSVAVRRLATFCKLWGTLKYFHPYLAYRSIDWDSAFVSAAKEISTAHTGGEYRHALESLLGSLADPVTRVIDSQPGTTPPAGDTSPRWRFTDDSILVVTIDRYSDLEDLNGTGRRFQLLKDAIPHSQGLVIDLRSRASLSEDERGYLDYVFARSRFANALSTTPVVTPGERARMHLGYPPQSGTTSGGYSSAFYLLDGMTISPAPGASDKPIAFLINNNSEIPSVALGLQSAGKAVIVAEGLLTEAVHVRTSRFDAGEGVSVEFRRGELVNLDGSGGIHALAVPQQGDGRDRAFETAIELVRKGAMQRPGANPVLPQGHFIQDRAYMETAYPSTELRLLAAARIWVVINYFFPYKHLMNEDWDKTLEEFIPRFMASRDSTEYALSVAEMMTRIHDSHAYISGTALRQYFGEAAPPLVVRMIEHRPVVTGFRDDSIATASGVSIGDVIVAVDGEEAGTRLKRYERYLAASTLQSLAGKACGMFLNGPDNSVATLAVRDRRNQRKMVRLIRKKSYPYVPWRSGDILKVLPGRIGYADLDRLTVSMVDSMFDLFRETRSIIFDMRGYPEGTAWEIAPRLTEKSDVAAAAFHRATVMYPDGRNGEYLRQTQEYSFTQAIPRTSGWRYKNPTVMLIDERTISQAEHTGLFFRAANRTAFVGSHTTGANGDVTNFFVPGGITISFSGQGVTYPDGTQLQRIGLAPDVEVSPTIEGIRRGRDEVLEKAIRFIETGEK